MPTDRAAEDVGPEEAARRAAEGSAVLLDVREPDEWTAGHAPGARHVPLDGLDPGSLPADRTIIAVCRSGNRSGQAALRLRAAGLDVSNLVGGMQAWAAAGLPVRRDDGTDGTVA